MMNSKNCPTCGDSFKNMTAVKIHHTKTHGESIAGFEYNCAWCDNSVVKPTSQYEKAFCSDSCRDNWQSENWSGEDNPNYQGKTLTLSCNYCGSEFERLESQTNLNRGKYCSQSCKGKDKTGSDSPVWNSREIKCEECGEKFYAKKSRDSARFCSYDCHHDSMDKGERVRYGKGWIEIRRQVRERANHECEICGLSCEGSHHHVHHIIPVREFDEPENAHYNENLTLLCNTHHPEMENISVDKQSEMLNRNPVQFRP